MGSVGESNPGDYSVPKEAQKLFVKEILNNPLVPTLPWEIKAAGKHISFAGNDLPSLPINWRFAESAAALKAFEASMLNVLRKRKYASPMSEAEINTDHASLFVMSPFLLQVVNPETGGEAQDVNVFAPGRMEELGFPNTDLHRAGSTPQRALATNIYQTKDGRFYHLHGSMDPEPTLTALGMETDGPGDEDRMTVTKRFEDVVAKIDSQELDSLMNDRYRQAGTICYSAEEYRQSEHGQANAHVGLYELSRSETHTQPAAWWPENASMPSSPQRPLAGLKVVDLTRVIASPAIGRSLAEMGASVMRVTSSQITDMSILHQDLNWGKWNCSLHLKHEPDRRKLIALIQEADVVIEGYRPGVMAKYGLAREDIFELVRERGRGIVHVKENCYGWHGPWAGRSGWQQISDANCGVSWAYGRAMGNDEAVTPVFPNSDYCTGIVGSVATLHALVKRAEQGGCYGVDVSLNYYSQWLVNSVGEYPPDVWNALWARCGNPAFRHYHNMGYLLPAMLGLLRTHAPNALFKPDFFQPRFSKAVGCEFVSVKPIARFKDEEVRLGYHVGTRGNGKDAPYWPEDLSVEVVV
ncbi:-transferase family III [Lecanosticta acicola]|uniref:-transferase family III n=1 Tax=Lecanosticta acicola TaxID=111012 RepID=A0AAI8W1A5_9PEZI|nr:-transferase family III [Lecanosticta acicola]